MEKNFADIDAYLQQQTEEVRNALERIRLIVKEVVPKAEETISYGMPAFKYHGMLVYFAAFKNHCSLFPGGGDIMEIFKEELQGFTTSKGTIQFTVDKQIPKALLKKIVKERKLQNECKVIKGK